MKLELKAFKNGEEVPLSEVSVETFKKMREPKPEPKPELRHGDLVQARSGDPVYLAIEQTPPTEYINIWGNGYLNGKVRKTETYYKKIGQNIFDDLERNKVDLEEFERAYQNTHNTFKAKLWGSTIDFQTAAHKYNSFCIKEAIDLHQKLGQMICTAQRRIKK